MRKKNSFVWFLKSRLCWSKEIIIPTKHWRYCFWHTNFALRIKKNPFNRQAWQKSFNLGRPGMFCRIQLVVCPGPIVSLYATLPSVPFPALEVPRLSWPFWRPDCVSSFWVKLPFILEVTVTQVIIQAEYIFRSSWSCLWWGHPSVELGTVPNVCSHVDWIRWDSPHLLFLRAQP